MIKCAPLYEMYGGREYTRTLELFIANTMVEIDQKWTKVSMSTLLE